MPLRIAVIDPSLYTPPYDQALAGGLASLGHDVRLYGPAGGESHLSPSESFGYYGHFYRLLGIPSMRALPRPLVRTVKGASHAGSMLSLARELASYRPDAIHFQWVPLPVIDRLLLPALRQIAPLVLTVHDSNPFNGNPNSRLEGLGAHKILSAFDGLIVHTDQALKRMRTLGIPAVKLHKVAHGLLSVGAGRAPIAVDQSDDGRLELLLFGKVKPYKGIDVLIDAVGMLDSVRRDRITVRVVGKPYQPTAPLLERAADRGVSANFEFDLRFVPDAELAGMFDRAAALVFPYREIDASGVLMVGLDAGRPVIASAIGNFAEILADGQDSLLVPAGDARALAGALQRFIDDSALRAKLREGACRLRDRIPDWSAIANSTLEVYAAAGQSLLARAEAARP